MLCPKCGFDLPENSKTCSKCGQALTSAAVTTSASGAAAVRAPAAPPAPQVPKRRWAVLVVVPVLVLMIWWARSAAKGYAPGASPQMFWVEFCCVLSAILIGIRRGGVALGLIGGLGLSILVLGFRTQPSTPPIDVMLIILAVVTAAATLQVAGGLDYMVQLAERLLRAHPKHVTLLAPFCCFFLTVCVGTGHAVYALLPVIADVALHTRIRPERPMAVSSVAAQMGITASPVSAAVGFFLAFAAKTSHPVSLIDILKITMPAGIVGLLAAALWSMNRGKDLDKDPAFQKRMQDPDFAKALDISVTTLDKKLPRHAKSSVLLFFSGVAVIVLLALDKDFFHLGLLSIGKSTVSVILVVQMVMLAFGAFILFLTNVKAADIARSSVFIAGMIAVVSIFGIAWMSDTFVTGNKPYLVAQMQIHGDRLALDVWDRHVLRIRLRQEPGGNLGGDDPVWRGSEPAKHGYAWPAARQLRLLLFLLLSERSGSHQHGPYRHHRHRQVPVEPQLHDSGADRRRRLHRDRLSALACVAVEGGENSLNGCRRLRFCLSCWKLQGCPAVA